MSSRRSPKVGVNGGENARTSHAKCGCLLPRPLSCYYRLYLKRAEFQLVSGFADDVFKHIGNIQPASRKRGMQLQSTAPCTAAAFVKPQNGAVSGFGGLYRLDDDIPVADSRDRLSVRHARNQRICKQLSLAHDTVSGVAAVNICRKTYAMAARIRRRYVARAGGIAYKVDA